MKAPHADVRLTIAEVEAIVQILPNERDHYRTPLGDAIKKIRNAACHARAAAVGFVGRRHNEQCLAVASDGDVKKAARDIDIAAKGMTIDNPAVCESPVHLGTREPRK